MGHKSQWALISATILSATSCQTIPQLGVDPTTDVVAAMTLDEKVRLLVGPEMDDSDKGSGVGENTDIVPGAAGATYAIPRLGIPSIVMADGPSGLRISPRREGDSTNYHTTLFPSPTMMASTWAKEIVERSARCIGKEALDYGVDIVLAPAINMHRDPLNGRNFEYFGEGQVLSAELGTAFTRGIQAQGVGAAVKHFAVNNQETNRQRNDAILTQRALRDTYLRAFRFVVREANPWMVMSSYNKINGQYASQSKDLLQTILRDEWGYKGVVVSDWYAGTDAVAQVEARNDLLMPGKKSQYDEIIKAVNDGRLDVKYIDRNVTDVLELIVKTPRFAHYPYPDSTDLAAHARLARKAAQEGIVMLKNDGNALPLKDSAKRIALLGVGSYDFIMCGTGSGHVDVARPVTLQEALSDAGFELNATVGMRYGTLIRQHYDRLKDSGKIDEDGFMPNERPGELRLSNYELGQLAADNDVAIITISRKGGEFVDRKVSDLSLTDDELHLISSASETFHAQGKKVIVLLNIGGVVLTKPWDALVDALLVVWYPGQEGTRAIADIVSGAVSPSGHLTVTFPVRYEDVPTYGNFPTDGEVEAFDRDAIDSNTRRRRNYDYTLYQEDVHAGYRYYDTFGIPVAYPYGHGLTYTTFEIGNATIAVESENTAEIQVDVTNTGMYPAREVLQVYVYAHNAIPGVSRYEKTLKTFGKTPVINPGETHRMKLRISPDRFAAFDPGSTSWHLMGGKYDFFVGTSIDNLPIKLTATLKHWERKVHDVLNPPAEFVDSLGGPNRMPEKRHRGKD